MSGIGSGFSVRPATQPAGASGTSSNATNTLGITTSATATRASRKRKRSTTVTEYTARPELKPVAKKMRRPAFRKVSRMQVYAKLQTAIDSGVAIDPTKKNLRAVNGAQPHRIPQAYLKLRIVEFLKPLPGVTTAQRIDTLNRWSERLIDANKERANLWLSVSVHTIFSNMPYQEKLEAAAEIQDIVNFINENSENIEKKRDALVKAIEFSRSADDQISAAKQFLSAVNSAFANIPDIGPHFGINHLVSDNLHLHIKSDGTTTPGTNAALAMTPKRGFGVAVDEDTHDVIGTDGRKTPLASIDRQIADAIARHGLAEISGTFTIFGDGAAQALKQRKGK
ncbi:MAG: hypothetical protein AAFR47_23505 [Pseudomonadota bacterium]